MYFNIKKNLKALFVFVSILSLPCVAALKEMTSQENVYGELLLSNDSTSVKLGASVLYSESINHPVLMSVVSHLLTEGLNKSIDLHEDTLAWLIKALGRSNNCGYREKLSLINTQSSKIKKYIRKSIKSLKKCDSKTVLVDEQQGRIGLTKTIKESKTASHKNRDIKAFYLLKTGDSLAEVLNSIQQPDLVKVGLQRKRNRWLVFVVVNDMRLDLIYNQAGRLRFNKVKSDFWKLEYIDPIIDDSKDLLVDFKKIYLIKDIASKRLMVQKIYKEKTGEQVHIDVLADYLWRNMQTDESVHIDTLSWIVRVLNDRDSKRYNAMLLKISHDAHSRKLKRYAKKHSDKKLKDVDGYYKPMTKNDSK